MHTTFTLFYVHILFHTLLSFWQPFGSMECIYVSAMIYVCFVIIIALPTFKCNRFVRGVTKEKPSTFLEFFISILFLWLIFSIFKGPTIIAFILSLLPYHFISSIIYYLLFVGVNYSITIASFYYQEGCMILFLL